MRNRPVRIFFLVLCVSGFRAWGLNPKLSNVRDWCYILQHDSVGPPDIAATDFDLVVMDYSSDGSGNGEFTASEILQIKATGKVVLAYLSIGEAESYRYYFNPAWLDTNGDPGTDAPSWLGPTNPDWAGNYKVRYWEPGWKAVLYGTVTGASESYLDRIIDQGFDGVYLDIIDAFEFWSDPAGGNEVTRTFARTEMKNLVGQIRDYAATVRGVSNFLVFPQNGSAIIYDDNESLDSLGEEFLGLVDGIGAEDTWYNELDPQPIAEREFVLQLLDLFRSHNGSRLVLSVDYVWDLSDAQGTANKQRFNDFHSRSRSRGYIPYAAVSDRNLDEIVIRPVGDGFLFSQPDTTSASVSRWKLY